MNEQRRLFTTQSETRIVSFEVDTDLFLRFQDVCERKGLTWKAGLKDFMQRMINDVSGAV